MPDVKPWEDTRVAPNGRAVKDNFQAWFRDSQVLDPNGDPLPVNHGTLDDFSRFRLNRGFHTTGAIHFAHRDNDWYIFSYLESLKFRDDLHESRGEYFVMPSYLKMERPLRIHTSEETGGWADEDSERQWVRQAKASNHDGLIICDADKETTFYLVFYPRQIKSAIGNSGLYLPRSEDVCDTEAARRMMLYTRSSSLFSAPSEPRMGMVQSSVQEARTYLAGITDRKVAPHA